MIKLRVIKPLKYPPDRVEVLTTLYYPYTFFKFLLKIKKVLRPNVRIYAYVFVDMARGRAYPADSIPEIEEREVSNGELVPPRINLEEAESLARRFLAYYAMRVWKAFIPPEIEVKEVIEARKIYWLVKTNEEIYVFDSIFGDVEKVGDIPKS